MPYENDSMTYMGTQQEYRGSLFFREKAGDAQVKVVFAQRTSCEKGRSRWLLPFELALVFLLHGE